MLLTRATSTTTKAASSAVAIVNQVLIQQIIYSSKRQTNACQHVARGPILENVAILKRTTLTVQHFVAKVTGRFEQIVAQCLQNIAQNQPKSVFSRELKILTHFQYCHKLAKHLDIVLHDQSIHAISKLYMHIIIILQMPPLVFFSKFFKYKFRFQ